jgi:hypothetical protein
MELSLPDIFWKEVRIMIDKLQFNVPGDKRLIINAPKHYLDQFDNHQVSYDLEIECDVYHVIQIFGISNEEIMQFSTLYIDFLEENGKIWLCYPSKTSSFYQGTNCNYDSVSTLLSEYDYKPISLISLDDDFLAVLFNQ